MTLTWVFILSNLHFKNLSFCICKMQLFTPSTSGLLPRTNKIMDIKSALKVNKSSQWIIKKLHYIIERNPVTGSIDQSWDLPFRVRATIYRMHLCKNTQYLLSLSVFWKGQHIKTDKARQWDTDTILRKIPKHKYLLTTKYTVWAGLNVSGINILVIKLKKWRWHFLLFFFNF